MFMKLLLRSKGGFKTNLSAVTLELKGFHMNAILYRCTDFKNAHVGRSLAQRNQFVLGYVTVYDHPCKWDPHIFTVDDDGHVIYGDPNKYVEHDLGPSKKVLSFIDVSSIQMQDFDKVHKCLLVDDPSTDPYTSATSVPYNENKQYFEPICDLADYFFVTVERLSLQHSNDDQLDTDVITLYFANAGVAFMAKRLLSC